MATYPPPNHLLRDLRATSCWVSDDELQVYLPISAQICDEQGVQVGVLASALDIAGAQVAMSVVEHDWLATSDLSYRPSGGVIEGPVVISTRLLRSGGRVVVVRSEVFDGRGEESPTRHAGTGVMTFTRLPRDVSEADEVPRRREVGVRHTMSDDAAGFDQRPADKMGLLEIGPGVLELEKSPYVLNSFGTVNGGATAITAASAAESAVGGGVATDLSVRYVGRAGEGPVRTVSRAMADYGSYVSVDIELVDTSNNDELVALATVGVAKPN